MAWDWLVPLTMEVPARGSKGPCLAHKIWLLGLQECGSDRYYELMCSALSAPMNGAYQAIGKLVGLAARASQALGARNFACDNGAAVVLYGLAGESNSTLHSA